LICLNKKKRELKWLNVEKKLRKRLRKKLKKEEDSFLPFFKKSRPPLNTKVGRFFLYV